MSKTEVKPGWVWDEVVDLDYIHAAHVLGVPVGLLRKGVPAKRLPHMRIGKHVRFGTREIAEIRRMHHQSAATTDTDDEGLARLRAAIHAQQSRTA